MFSEDLYPAVVIAGPGLLTPPKCTATDGLCRPRETNYFSCQTANQKWISICGAPDGPIQYRFGRPDRVEFTYPPVDAKKDALKFAHHTRYQTDRVELTFTIRGADYTVFDYTEQAKRTAGVRVIRVNKPEVTIACTRKLQSKVARLESKLECDTDNALNLGQCSPPTSQ